MLPSNAADWIAVGFFVAILYVLVRPRSKAGELVDAFMQFMISLARSATDLASAGT